MQPARTVTPGPRAVTLVTVRFERAVRLPLQIGTTSLWALCRGAFLLVPGIAAVIASILALAGAALLSLIIPGVGWVVLGVVLLELALVRWAARSLRLAARSRPSDVVLDREGLLVEGGPRDGTRVPWSALSAGSAELRTVEDGALQLLLRAGSERPQLLAQAEDPLERSSLRALAATIASFDRATEEPLEKPAPIPGEVELLVCAECGAPATPVDAAETACRACGAKVTVPPAMRERLAAVQKLETGRKSSQAIVRQLLDQPSARRENVLLLVVALPSLVAWSAAFFAMAVLYARHTLAFLNVALLTLAVVSGVSGLFFLMRARLANRIALRILTVDLAARAPRHDGDPWSCRVCFGPLPAQPDKIVTSCVYCKADNVLGIDLRDDGRAANDQAASLGKTLALRARELRLWRVRALASFGLLPLAAWSVAVGLRPLTPETAAIARCDRGEPAGCVEAARFAIEAPRNDTKRARELYARACEKSRPSGAHDGCLELARSLLLGASVGADLSRAHQLFSELCDADVGAGCSGDAELYVTGRGVPADLVRARALFERGCTARDAVACRRLGEFARFGAGGPVDLARSAQLFEQACEANDGDGCALLGEALRAGRGVPADPAGATLRFERACALESALGCSYVADAILDRSDDSRTRASAIVMLRKGCNSALEGRSCFRLAGLHERGAVPDTQYDTAEKYATAGCSYGSAEACQMAAAHAARSGSTATAKTLKARACALGLAEACE